MTPSDLFRVIRPDAQTLPVVVDVPHAGELIPPDVLARMAVGDRVLRRDLDLYVDQLWQDAPAHGATLIASNVSRYVVDLNRAPDDVAPQAVRGAVAKHEPGYYRERGVVWRTTTDGRAVLPKAMSPEAFAQRIATFYTPYHAAIAQEIARVREQFGYCILVDGHSMPSQGRVGHSDPGARRADVVPGDIEGQACAGELSELVCEHFRQENFSVALNVPYKGGWITRNYGRPAEGVHAIQIELNRALYMNESTFEQRPLGMERLRRACAALLPKLANVIAP